MGSFDGKALERAWVDAAWARVMEVFYSPKTGCIYVCPPDEVQAASDFPGGLLRPELGYGVGLEDCAINGGVALSGLVDAYVATHDAAFAAEASKIARGLLNLVTAHSYRGFVARGLCVEDGRSICRLSSRDQVTHWVHGLWRWWRAGLVPEALRDTVRRAFHDVAARMERTVTAENGWSFLQADGTPDPVGICKMRETMPHEAARLAMVYAAAGEITGDPRWTGLYRTHRGEALSGSSRFALLTGRETDAMPCYSLHQMNASLEVLLGIEEDRVRRASILESMAACAKLAKMRAKAVRGGDSRYLCACGEVHLAQLMVPEPLCAWDPEQRALLSEAIAHTPASETGACRAVHLFAAYWRATACPPASPNI